MADTYHKYLINSEVTVLVNNAVKAAGIEIPFLQRELHLRTVDDNAGNKFKKNQGNSLRMKKIMYLYTKFKPPMF